jgi:hypothetical protein
MITERKSRRVRWRHAILMGLLLALLAWSIGPEYYTIAEWNERVITRSISGWGFNLVDWEVDALSAKLHAAITRPAADLNADEAARLVHAYLDRAERMAALEREIAQLLAASQTAGLDGASIGASVGTAIAEPDVAALQTELDALRTQQQRDRAAVEQVIQAQVSSEVAAAGMTLTGRTFPPVLFSFTEPPKKMVVSPRDRIATVYAHMLDEDIGLETIEEVEESIYEQLDLSAYITNIGGLGAFPTMVVDRASLEWILSTVAHEWVHNYLTLFPLGLRYAVSPELTTINETVAEIVGNEIGARALARYYPDLVPPPPDPYAEPPHDDREFSDPPPFDFHTEMRETRLEVDRLLAAGQVAEAEAYMEERRHYFAENGHPLRVLNQAYFAFHGSYGTSPASSSPIGPKLEQLRAAVPDLETFLREVRWFTTAEDVDAALAKWQD